MLKTDTDPLPQDFIFWCKNHAINHNWDLAFVALSAFPGDAAFRAAREHLTGRDLLESCDGYRGAAWIECHVLCQAIQDSGPLPETCLHRPEELVLLFEDLRRNGFVCSIATGRPRIEAMAPLERSGIRKYFDPSRILTHDDVQSAESEAKIPLGKPHPFVALKAIYPDLPVAELLGMKSEVRAGVWFIGDAVSDVHAALGAGVTPIGILGALPDGPYREGRADALRRAGCQTLLGSVLRLPSELQNR